MMLSPTSFNQFLNQVGQDFGWRKSFACPCVNPHSGAAKPTCRQCAGKGRMWRDSVPGKAGIVSRDAIKDVATFGAWEEGDIALSIPSDSPLYEIGQFDRVSATNRSEPFSYNMIRGVNDKLLFVPLSIDRVFVLDAGENPVDCGIPTVGADGVPVWASNPPPPGKTYSISGRRVPEYFVYRELPTDRPLHFGRNLPRRIVLRRFDLFGR